MLGGKPLLAWTIKMAKKCKLRTIVSSDSDKYLQLAKRMGCDTLKRPEHLAGDDTSMYEVLKSEVKRIHPYPDVVVLMQPTTPFRAKEDVEGAIKALADRASVTSVITMEEVPEKYNPEQVFITVGERPTLVNGQAMFHRETCRQKFQKAYVPTGSVYVFRAKNLDDGNIYGSEPRVYVTRPNININTIEDFRLAEEYLKKYDGEGN